MSASREKRTRQGREAGELTAKQQKALTEQKENRRTTLIFTVCAVLFAVCVVGMLLWNSQVIQRGAAAVRVNGKTYTAADVAYYYYNGRANLLGNSSNGIDANTSLRSQTYTDGTRTWFDYLSESAVSSLANNVLAADAATAAGFTGGEDVSKEISDTLDSLKAAAASNGYSVAQYLKALYGPLMTRSVFEKNLRMNALAEAYAASLGKVESYSDAQLSAVYDADPNACSQVSYEAIVFSNSSFATEAAEATDTTPAVEADDGSAAALTAAQAALARYKAGESLSALADELNGSYAETTTLYGAGGSDMVEWLFDDARKDGDADVKDYSYYGFSMGSIVLVYHGKERVDYHTVSVRHILVDDEAKADDLLAQYNAGDKTEDAFAALARENSTDNAEDGGLYEGIRRGQMVEPFEAWCFDPARQTGDTGVVKTDYGYHVMYFVSTSPYAYWQELAASKLASDWETQLSEGMTTETLAGMKYIDR